jgi:Ca2+-binding EF-hand superfamily protein
MKLSCHIALALGILLGCGVVRAGEDKPIPRQDKAKPADAAKPATEDNKSFDVDAFIKRFDKNKDGVLQRDELPSMLRGRFAEMDDNKDGKLSAEELRAHADVLRQWHNVVSQRQERLMGLAAYISHVARSDTPVRELAQTAYDLLRQIDKNNDGKIDDEEWEAMRQNLRERRVEAILQRQGADKDGRISKEHAWGRVKRHFDEWDLNKDGFVDREELLKVFENPPARQQPVKIKDRAKNKTKAEEDKKK